MENTNKFINKLLEAELKKDYILENLKTFSEHTANFPTLENSNFKVNLSDINLTKDEKISLVINIASEDVTGNIYLSITEVDIIKIESTDCSSYMLIYTCPENKEDLNNIKAIWDILNNRQKVKELGKVVDSTVRKNLSITLNSTELVKRIENLEELLITEREQSNEIISILKNRLAD